MPDQDLPQYPTNIDNVFEALARLAGALEAQRTLRRSAAQAVKERRNEEKIGTN